MTPAPELEDARTARALPGHTLPLGTRLRDYEVTGLIGEGTCSIVYLAWDHSLQRKVAVKEYMPTAIAARLSDEPGIITPERHVDTFKAGLAAFINEGRLLARFDHPSLVKVYRFWEENGTAYMVMPYYEGPSLKAALAELGHVPSEDELRAWLKPILNAITVLHEGGTWHQNIGPDEIILTPIGPVLLGLAAAAHAIEATRHTPAAALKAGFAAIEQYGSEAGSTRGPWTDLYALAAVVYAAITGTVPLAAADRLANDRLRPLTIVAAGLYSPALPGRDRRRHGGAAEAAAGQPRRVPGPDGRHRSARSGLAGAAPRPDAGALRRHAGQRARDHRARPADSAEQRAGRAGCRREGACHSACAGPRASRRCAQHAVMDERARRAHARQARPVQRHRRDLRADRHRCAWSCSSRHGRPHRAPLASAASSASRAAAPRPTCRCRRRHSRAGRSVAATAAAARAGAGIAGAARRAVAPRAPSAPAPLAVAPTAQRGRQRRDRRAGRAPEPLHRHPAEGLAREDHPGGDRFLQAGVQ